MRKITLFVVFITLLCASCAGWQKTSWQAIDAAQKSGEVSVKLAVTIIQQQCQVEVDKCKGAGDSRCPGFHKCNDFVVEVVKAYTLFQMACADAESALAIANDPTAEGKVLRAIQLLAELREQIRLSGYLQ